MRAASPRRRTSSTIARTDASTSSATSRLAPSSAVNRASKSLSVSLNRAATLPSPVDGGLYTLRAGFRLAFANVVARPGLGRPSGAEIGKPGLDDLDLDCHGRPTGKHQGHSAAG